MYCAKHFKREREVRKVTEVNGSCRLNCYAGDVRERIMDNSDTRYRGDAGWGRQSSESKGERYDTDRCFN